MASAYSQKSSELRVPGLQCCQCWRRLAKKEKPSASAMMLSVPKFFEETAGDCVSLGISAYSACLRRTSLKTFKAFPMLAEAALTVLQFVGAGHVWTPAALACKILRTKQPLIQKVAQEYLKAALLMYCYHMVLILRITCCWHFFLQNLIQHLASAFSQEQQHSVNQYPYRLLLKLFATCFEF